MATSEASEPKTNVKDKQVDGSEVLETSTTIATLPPAESPNPWADTLPPPSSPDTAQTMSPPAADDPVFAPISDDRPVAPLNPPVSAAVIDEFDPLVEDQAGWADMQGHPPAPPPKETPAPPPTSSGHPIDAPTQTSASGGGLSTLAAFASKLSISLPRTSSLSGQGANSPTAKGRPQSFDAAAPVASPMLRNFAAQFKRVGKRQSASTAEPPISDQDTQFTDEFVDDEVGPESRVQSPARPAVPSKDDEKPFDFQLFLDQMKTRGAEPVAKYLRS
jgi:hypothetical protein